MRTTLAAAGGAKFALGRLRNNLAYGGMLHSNMSSDTANNSWALPVSVSDDDFASVETTGWDAPRQADGGLPVLTLLRLVAGSDLIDPGSEVGLPFRGKGPDLGAFEH